jgi:hypothetical protein
MQHPGDVACKNPQCGRSLTPALPLAKGCFVPRLEAQRQSKGDHSRGRQAEGAEEAGGGAPPAADKELQAPADAGGDQEEEPLRRRQRRDSERPGAAEPAPYGRQRPPAKFGTQEAGVAQRDIVRERPGAAYPALCGRRRPPAKFGTQEAVDHVKAHFGLLVVCCNAQTREEIKGD